MKLKSIFITLILLSLSTFLFAQSVNLNFVGAGARARGMGGAFIGVADDATAASWNPAGLPQLEKAEASVAAMFESYTPSSDATGFDAEPYKYSHFSLNFGSLALPLAVGDRNLVAAVAYHKVLDLYYGYEDDFSETERTGGVNAIIPSIGIQLTPMISVGASANIYTGTTDYTSKVKSGYFEDTEESYDYSGTNFTIGGLVDLNQLSLGVVFKTPFGLNETNSDTDYDVDINMPSMLGFGVSYKATDVLTIAADYEMRKFSNASITYNEDYINHRKGVEEDLNYEDLNQFRLGMEYLVVTGNNVMPVRLGFATTPTPFKDDNNDQIVGINLAAGIGLIMGNLNLDLGIEYNTYSYEFETGASTIKYADNYLRFIVAGVFHLGK